MMKITTNYIRSRRGVVPAIIRFANSELMRSYYKRGGQFQRDAAPLKGDREQIIKLSRAISFPMQKAIDRFAGNKECALSRAQKARFSLKISTYKFVLSELQGVALAPRYCERYKHKKAYKSDSAVKQIGVFNEKGNSIRFSFTAGERFGPPGRETDGFERYY